MGLIRDSQYEVHDPPESGMLATVRSRVILQVRFTPSLARGFDKEWLPPE